MAEGSYGVPLNPRIFSEDYWEQWPGSDSRRAPDYARRAWVSKHVPWYSEGAWHDRAQRALLISDAYRRWRDARMLDRSTSLGRRTARTPEGREWQRATSAATQGTTQPPPTSAPPTSTVDRVLEIVRLLAEQYARYQEARANARAQRRTTMPFPQLLGGFSSASGSMSLPAVTTSGGWLPSLIGAATPLITRLLSEQESEERPDILERIGMATGVEGAIEREATFWLPTRSGVRPNAEILARNPVTGRMGTWRYMGRPVLFSGDLATCRRVAKISARTARYSRRGSLRCGPRKKR